MLTINLDLDDESEKYLAEILSQEKTSSKELIKRLLRNHWLNLQPHQTVLERMGGYPPKHLLQGSGDLSDRDIRKQVIAERIENQEDEKIVKSALNSLEDVGGNPQKAGWLAWDAVKDGWEED